MKVCDMEAALRAIFFPVESSPPCLISISVQTLIKITWVKPVLSVCK